jgi:hypothetical protein
VHDLSFIARSGDIEKDQLIRALRVVSFGRCDGIACVAELLKLDALYDPARVDVETGNDAARKHAESSE